MKRIITLSLMLVTMLTAFAQTITPTDNQKWWGYVTADAARSAIGIQDIATYHCAIFIPGNNDVAAGKAINAVRLSIILASLAFVIFYYIYLPNKKNLTKSQKYGKSENSPVQNS